MVQLVMNLVKGDIAVMEEGIRATGMGYMTLQHKLQNLGSFCRLLEVRRGFDSTAGLIALLKDMPQTMNARFKNKKAIPEH